MEEFYQKIRIVGYHIGELCERFNIFEMDHPFMVHEIEYLKSMDSVMDLSYIVYQYFELGKEGIIENMNHVLDSQMITDDSDMNDIAIYHHAYIFLELNSNTSLYQGIIEEMNYLGKFYEDYFTHKKEFEEMDLIHNMQELNMK